MYYRNISDLNKIILKRLSIIPRDIDLIVGIPRSGMLPANLLALYLNKPYTDIHSFLNGHIYKAGERSRFFESGEFRNILVVDDSLASGSAMEKCKDLLKDHAARFSISYCVIYVAPGREKLVDLYFEAVPLPRYFQWNIFNHTSLEKACFDIDGVLCTDPAAEQNDDGERYLDFITNAPPLYIPGAKIGTIVSSRLEKYRKQTEAWLRAHGVKYDKLVLLDLPDMESRQRANNHAEFKAGEYSSDSYVLFVESSLGQAREINRITKKPVFCTENFEMVFDSQSVLYNVKSGKYLPFIRRSALRVRNRIRNRR